MRKAKKIQLIADQIIFYSEGKVMRPIAEAEAEAYLHRRGLGSILVHGSTYRSVGKKLEMRCLGTPIW